MVSSSNVELQVALVQQVGSKTGELGVVENKDKQSQENELEAMTVSPHPQTQCRG